MAVDVFVLVQKDYKIQQTAVDNYPAGARRMKQMIESVCFSKNQEPIQSGIILN